MTQYQICVLGSPDWRLNDLKARLSAAESELGIPPGTVALFDEADAPNRDVRFPLIAVFFGYPGATDGAHPVLPALLGESVTIIPVVTDLNNARAELPSLLEEINALEFGSDKPNGERLTSLIFESFRLLRRDRRLFISYKRADSQSLADRLYDEFDRRGFDVFIDTRGVPPAANFQDELWHRLSDSDVVVLIDTPNFRASRWTTEELAKANATNIQILHLLWPGQPPDATSAFSHFYSLHDGDFVAGAALGGIATIKPAVLADICDTAEKLRARAMAARYRYLVDNFCDIARSLGLTVEVQPERWILVTLPNGQELAVVPAIGVPTSDRINEVFDAITELGRASCTTWITYDNRGLLGTWLQHLDWLDMHLPVRSVRVSAAAAALEKLVT